MSNQKPRTLNQALQPAVVAFATSFAGVLQECSAEEVLVMFGKELPKQPPPPPKLCRRKCGAPVVCDDLCIVHFSSKLLGYEVPLTITVLRQKGFSLPEQSAETPKEVNGTILEKPDHVVDHPAKDPPAQPQKNYENKKEVVKPWTGKWPLGGMLAIEKIVELASLDFEVTKEVIQKAKDRKEISGPQSNNVYVTSAKGWIKKNCKRKG